MGWGVCLYFKHMEIAEFKTYCLDPKIRGQYLILQVLKIINLKIYVTTIIKVTMMMMMMIKVMLTTKMIMGRCVG